MQHPHSLIAMVTGALTVNVPTVMDNLCSANTVADLVLFCIKGMIGGFISVGITRAVDRWMKKRNKATTETEHE